MSNEQLTMKKIAYFECPTGIAGDMCLGALVHAGVPLTYLVEKLNLLGISQEYQLRAETVHRNSQQATKVYVDLTSESTPEEVEPTTFDHSHEHQKKLAYSHATHRHLPEIEAMILQAGLPDRAERWSLQVFRQLAVAEGAVHGVPPEKVHFHEVGAIDAIVDVVGTCLGLDWLGIEALYCSPLPTGGGTVQVAHGRLAVPTPAVMKLWELHQVPVYSNGIERELCTPTGTALAVTLAQSFGRPPAMTMQRVGLGAGSRDLPIPNILRLWIGESLESSVEPGTKERELIVVLETQIDDLSPQAMGYVFEALFLAGALDVFTQPVTMKKSRLGVLLTVICRPDHQLDCERVIFQETTTLGIRTSTQFRTILQREIQIIKTELGEVRVKIAKTGPRITHVQPEYEDCAEIARTQQISWREVHRIVLQSWHLQHSASPF